MDFTEAYKQLNQGSTREVANEMKEWHPVILGEMLKAVQEAKDKRYLSYHPGYEGVLMSLAAKAKTKYRLT